MAPRATSAGPKTGGSAGPKKGATSRGLTDLTKNQDWLSAPMPDEKGKDDRRWQRRGQKDHAASTARGSQDQEQDDSHMGDPRQAGSYHTVDWRGYPPDRGAHPNDSRRAREAIEDIDTDDEEEIPGGEDQEEEEEDYKEGEEEEDWNEEAEEADEGENLGPSWPQHGPTWPRF